MPHLLNHAENPFDFPISTTNPETGTPIIKRTVKVTRALFKDDGKGNGAWVPGEGEVSDEDLKTMRAHHVAKTWFAPNKLVVAEAPPAKADKR